jgi:hypothetical protein
LKERERERESWLRKRRPFVKFRQEQREKGNNDDGGVKVELGKKLKKAEKECHELKAT